MKYLQKRSNTYYYRRRVPTELQHLSSIKVIYRPLSTDKDLAETIATKYNHLFNMVKVGLKLKTDVGEYLTQLDLINLPTTDIYQQYLNSQEVGEDRLKKITRILKTIRELLPKDLSKTDMNILDSVRTNIINLPRRNLSKYKNINIIKLTEMVITDEDKISVAAAKDYLSILNSFLQYLHEREILYKLYSVKLVKKQTDDRSERISLTRDTILRAVKGARTDKLAASYILLYLTGMRPSEAYKCKVSIVNGIKCFDLRDKSIQLKTKSSYRLIPVHKSITHPEQMLEDYCSMKPRMISRGFLKNVSEGTLYSLRHSFATHLAAKGIEPYIISELLGHTHNGMTMGRYVKGLPISILKDAIDTLYVG